MRRSRATTLLKTTTMQKVAWPTMIVYTEKGVPARLKADCRASPVTMPGRAMGSTSIKDTASRPKKRKRWMPKETRTPSTSAITVATTPALRLSQNAERTAWSCQATENHERVQCWIGKVWTLERSKAKRVMTTRGAIKNKMTRPTKVPSAMRIQPEILIGPRRRRPSGPGRGRRP